MTLYSKIIGTGSYLPEQRVTNQELTDQLAAKGIETSDEWIVTRSGISARHYAAPEQKSSDLAVHAAKRALDMAGMQPDDIDLIIVASSTPDFLGSFPSTACMLQQKLGMTNNSAAVDVQAVCSGFVYAVSTANSFIKAGEHKNVLVIGAEVFSQHPELRGPRHLRAVRRWRRRRRDDRVGRARRAGHGPARGRPPLPHPQHSRQCGRRRRRRQRLPVHDGPAVFKLAVSVLEKVAHETLEKPA